MGRGCGRAGQAKEIAEAAEELYRALRAESVRVLESVLHPKWQQQVVKGVHKGREGEGEGEGCHRTRIKAAGAAAAAAAAAAVAFNVYFACQGT